MAYITPKTNWASADVPTKDDFNRIEGNVVDLKSVKEDKTTVTALTLRVTSVESGKVDKVTGKELSTNDYTTTEKNKLAGIVAGAQVNTVTSVAGKTGAVVVTKADVGLSSLLNYGIATKAEAEAGTSNAKYMTPLRVKEVTDSLSPTTSVVTRTGSSIASKGYGILTIPLGKTPTRYVRLYSIRTNPTNDTTGIYIIVDLSTNQFVAVSSKGVSGSTIKIHPTDTDADYNMEVGNAFGSSDFRLNRAYVSGSTLYLRIYNGNDSSVATPATNGFLEVL